MIRHFGAGTALLVIDAQVGVDDLAHWGGPTGRRNNPQAEGHIRSLLGAWRKDGSQVVITLHDSREAASPLQLGLPGGRSKAGLGPRPGDVVISKDVNSAFVGTSLEVRLRRMGVRRLVVAGFFTNVCVDTTVRMAGNLGYDTYLVHDACATTNRVGPDGADHDPDLLHDISVANLHGEFCTAVATDDACSLLRGDRPDLERVQGNE